MRPRRRSKALVLLALWSALLGAQACKPAAPHAESERAEPRSSSVLPVAEVGTEIISMDQVSSLMAEEGSSAEQALERLVDQAVLFQAALEAGIEESRADRRELDRLMVRALLRDFERELSPERMSEKEVRELFEQHRDKMRVPERRASIHVLARDQGPRGKKMAERALKELRREDPEAVLARYAQGEVAASPELEVIAEELPPMSVKAEIDEAYKAALFEAPSPGPLRKPVKTAYGWHAIVLTEIVPATEPTLENAEPQLREWLAQSKRQANLVRILEPLEEQLVQWNEPVVSKLTRAERLPEPSQP